ncbi:MAG: TIGR04283 family arsenosugar biosynthesis glycosyltransferase [Gammaproteobacteria bacterium]
MRISVVIPALEEAGGIPAALEALAPLRARGHEVIVVDGGSRDGTADVARAGADRVLVAPRGRARQMNAGAAVARGELLLFLHADTRLPPDADRLLADALGCGTRRWGRFDVRLADSGWQFRIIERAMNLRSRLTGIATGDQAMFVERRMFFEAGGFAPIALMEDIALSAWLRRRHRPLCLRAAVTTSARRWRKHGIARTVLRMWWMRAAYACGVDPAWLASRYDAP